MFKKNFIDLCNKKKIAPTAACKELGLSAATFSCWTDESVPRRATLQRMADYFGVTIADLVGTPSITALSHEDANTEGMDADTFARFGANGVTVSVDGQAQQDPLLAKIAQLDDLDRGKVDGFVSGLLAADKYQTSAKIKKA
jgi:hypothetical protein